MMPLLSVLLSLLAVQPSEAACRNNNPICGSADICLSTEPPENVNDLRYPIHPTLCKVMVKMAAKLGKIELTSAYRTPAENKVRGGAPSSVHTKKAGGPAYAVDLRVNATRRQKFEFLGSQKCKGIRYNVYCDKNDGIHMDIDTTKPDNYSRCKDFFRPQCEDGSTPNVAQDTRSPVVEKYKAKKAGVTARPKCWQQGRYGSCCGPQRKSAGQCTG